MLEPALLAAGEYLENHKIMMKLAKDQGIPCLDTQEFIASHIDDGFLFWDFIHLTNFGQKLLAKALSKYLHALIQKTKTKAEGDILFITPADQKMIH